MYSIKTLTFALIALFFTTITYAQETPEQEEEDKLSLNEEILPLIIRHLLLFWQEF